MGSLSVVFLNHSPATYIASLEESALTQPKTVSSLVECIRSAHLKNCTTCPRDVFLEASVWTSSSLIVSSTSNAPPDLQTLDAHGADVETSVVFSQSPKQVFVIIRRDRKRPHSPTEVEKRPSPDLCFLSKGHGVYQVIARKSTSSKSLPPVWRTKGLFRQIIATPGAVWVDNTATLSQMYDGAFKDSTSRACIIFDSPSIFSARLLSSVVCFAHDKANSADFVRFRDSCVFFTRVTQPSSYCILDMDFSTMMDHPTNQPELVESVQSLQIALGVFIRSQVRAFLLRYELSQPLEAVSTCLPEEVIPTLLTYLQHAELRLIVSIHSFERVTERASTTSFWHTGVHGTLRPTVAAADNLFFSPVVASYRAKDGVVQKILITGSRERSYLEWTSFGKAERHDISNNALGLPLHGYSEVQTRTALALFSGKTQQQKGNLALVSGLPRDNLNRLRVDLPSGALPVVDPSVVHDTAEVLTAAQKKKQTLTSAIVEDRVYFQHPRRRFEIYARLLFPLLVRFMPVWVETLLSAVSPVDITLAYTHWHYWQLDTGDTGDKALADRLDTTLIYSVLSTLGLISFYKNSKAIGVTCTCIAGRHSKWVLGNIVRQVHAYKSVTVPVHARIPIDQIGVASLKRAMLVEIKQSKRGLPKDEADFQERLLSLLRYVVQFNGQWRHQVQLEPWFRCGSAEKCGDRRGDIVMLLKMPDGRCRGDIFELKYFELLATIAATRDFLKREGKHTDLTTNTALLRAALRNATLSNDWMASPQTGHTAGINTDQYVLRDTDIWAKYRNRKTGQWELKSAQVVPAEAQRQARGYVGGAICGVGEQYAAGLEDVPGFADVHFSKWAESPGTVMATFTPVTFVLISDLWLFGAEGKVEEVVFCPVVAGAFPWTADPTAADIQKVREAKAKSREVREAKEKSR